jgi:hypothetical protein
MSAYNAAGPTVLGITGADTSLSTRWRGWDRDRRYRLTTTTEGSAGRARRWGEPGGRLLSGKVLNMYNGMTGEFGTVGTSGGRPVVVVVVAGGGCARDLGLADPIRRVGGSLRICEKRVLTTNQLKKGRE